jgi:hypothetical protein
MKLICKARGKEWVVAEGDRKELAAKMRQLRQSQWGGVSGRGGKKYKADYRIEN